VLRQDVGGGEVGCVVVGCIVCGKGGCVVGGRDVVWWVVVKVWGVGLYSLSSSVGWWTGVLESSNTSLPFPLSVGSASIFLFSHKFS